MSVRGRAQRVRDATLRPSNELPRAGGCIQYDTPMQIARAHSAPHDIPVDRRSTSTGGFATDSTLVPGLVVPVVRGLPDASTNGWSLDYLKGPPAAGSAAAKAELAEVQAAQRLRTPEGDAWAVHLATDGSFRLWIDLARREHGSTGVVQSWLGTALLASTMAANAAVTQVVKHRFQRQRPFQVDPTIKPPVKLPHDSSYPSGHTSAAFAAARIISVLRPTLATEAYDLATQVAASRVYAGVHFPSDVRAGAQLGTQVAQLALRNLGLPDHTAMIEQLHAAGITDAQLAGTGLVA